MRVLGSGFRRIDDNKVWENKKSRSLKETGKDQSFLPIIKFEDSNGVSPANSATRWKTIEPTDGRDSNPNESVRCESLTWFSRTNPETGNRDFHQDFPRSSQNHLDGIVHQPASTMPHRKVARKKILFQPAAEVFDPFSVNDDEVYQSMGREAGIFDNSRHQTFDPSSNLHSFKENNSWTQEGFPASHQNECEPDCENLETKEDLNRKLSTAGATIEFEIGKENPHRLSHQDPELLQAHRDPGKECDNKISRTQAYLESLSRKRRQASAPDPLIQIENDVPTDDKNRGLSSRGVEVEQNPRQGPREDVETASSTSFPDRIDPLEFLKKERDSDKTGIYADRIFMNFDSDSCDPMQPRINFLSPLHATNSQDQDSEAEEMIRPVEIAAGVSSDNTGVEVIEVQTLESDEEGQIQGSHTSLHEFECQDHEAPSDGEGINHNSIKEICDSTSPAVYGMTPREKPRLGNSELLSPCATSTFNNPADSVEPQHRTPKSTQVDNTQASDNDKLSALQKFARMAAPVLSNGTFSLAKDDAIRKAAEKLGIPLSEGPAPVDQPADEQLEVLPNVDARYKRSSIALVQKKNSSKHSIHFQARQGQPRNLRLLPSASASLLDTASEISDQLHNSPQSTSSSIMPKKLPPAIDLTTVDSGGSLSELTFHAQSSHDSDDISHQHAQSDVAVGGVQETIPPKLVRRNEADSTRNVDKPHAPRARRTLNLKGTRESVTTHRRGGARRSFSSRRRPRKSFGSHRRPRQPSTGYDQQRKSGSCRDRRSRRSLPRRTRRFPEENGSRPLGATIEEIDMINKFLFVAGPDFDGANLTSDERALLYGKALLVGIEEGFVNRLLDQSAGIQLFERSRLSNTGSGDSDPSVSTSPRLGSPSESTVTGQSLRTKDTVGVSMDDHTKTTIGTSYSESTYDEEGFHKKTPKTDANFSCLANIFWMESSNIVGDDMMENVQAVMSTDSDLMSLYSRRRR